MPFELYLMRHGIAEDFDPASMKSDADRHLTAEGREKISAQSKALAELNLGIKQVLASPYARARETAELTIAGLGKKSDLEISDALVPHAAPEAILREIDKRKVKEATLLVGHEPHLGELASILLSGQSNLVIEVKKGSMMCFTIDRLQSPYRAQLNFLVPPKMLRAMR